MRNGSLVSEKWPLKEIKISLPFLINARLQPTPVSEVSVPAGSRTPKTQPELNCLCRHDCPTHSFPLLSFLSSPIPTVQEKAFIISFWKKSSYFKTHFGPDSVPCYISINLLVFNGLSPMIFWRKQDQNLILVRIDCVMLLLSVGAGHRFWYNLISLCGREFRVENYYNSNRLLKMITCT